MTMHSDVASVSGWYGKLPSLGDFASRRLEGDFIEPWDLWLGECMQARRDAAGDDWLHAYRRSPPWRFMLSSGVLPGMPEGVFFAGVLIASFDRVGRHFPLTLAASLPRLPKAAAEVDALLTWLHRLEDTAVDAVQGNWGIDDLEDALAALASPGDAMGTVGEDRLAAVSHAVASALASGGGFVEIGAVGSRAEFAAGVTSAFGAVPEAATSRWGGAPDPQRVAIWIAEPAGQPRLLVSTGLPGHGDFGRMFGGGGDEVDGSASMSASAHDAFAGTVGGHTLIPDDTDLLGLFDGVGKPADDAEPFPEPAPAADRDHDSADIFALLDAGASAARAAEPEQRRDDAEKDDILAMFDVPAAPAPGKTD